MKSLQEVDSDITRDRTNENEKKNAKKKKKKKTWTQQTDKKDEDWETEGLKGNIVLLFIKM